MSKFKVGDVITPNSAVFETTAGVSYSDIAPGKGYKVIKVEPAEYTGSWDTLVATPSSQYLDEWVGSKDFSLFVPVAEVTRKTVGGIHFTELQLEDIITFQSGEYFTVNRLIKPQDTEPEPGTLVKFTNGEHAFHVLPNYEKSGKAWRFLYSDGSTGMLSWEYIRETYTIEEN